jgi:hypothetical protein
MPERKKAIGMSLLGWRDEADKKAKRVSFATDSL